MKLHWALILVVIFAASCLKQEPLNVNKNKKYSEQYQFESQKCSEANLHIDVFTKNNFITIFDCLGWSNEFPRIQKFLTSLSSERFDSFTSKYNKKYFSSKESNETFYKLLKQINDPKMIREANQLIGILTSEKNSSKFLEFINHIKDKNWAINKLFIGTLPVYLKFKMKSGDTTELLKYSEIFDNPKVRKSLSDMTKDLISGTTQEGLRDKILKFVQDGSWPEKYLKSLTTGDVVQLNKVLIDGFYKTQEDVTTLVDFASNQRTNKCQAGGKSVFIDHELELYESANLVLIREPQDLLFDVAELVEKFSLYRNICEMTKSNSSYIEASEGVLKKTIDLLVRRGSFEFFNKLVEVNLTQDPSSVLSFFNFFKSEFIEDFYVIAKNLDNESGVSVYSEVLKLLSKFDTNDFILLREQMNLLSKGLMENEDIYEYMMENNEFFLIDLYSELMFNKFDFSKKVGSYLELLDFMPDTDADGIFIENFFVSLLHNVQDSEFRKELLAFLSEDSLYAFTGLLGRSENIVEEEATQKVEIETLAFELFSPVCVEKLRSIEEFNFDNLVKSGIFECSKDKKEYFFYNVYKWTMNLDELFQDKYGHKFSLNYGIVSPEMMSFYLNLILTIEQNVYTPDREYVLETIKNVKGVLSDQGFISALEAGTKTINLVNKRLNAGKHLIKALSVSNKKQEFKNSDITSLVREILSDEAVDISKQEICKSLQSKILVHECLSKQVFVNKTKDVFKLIMLENKEGKTFLSNLLDAIYGRGLKVPVDYKYAEDSVLSFNELLTFFEHASAVKTEKEIIYNQKNGSVKLKLNLAQRLETLIREINFNDNFYGIYFMNVASKAIKYNKQMRGLKRQLKLMVGSSGMFRRIGLFNDQSRWQFKNVWNTYQALLDLEGPFKTSYENEHSYVNLIQTIMSAAVKSSENHTVYFHPYRKPNPYFVKDHRGQVITALSELSVISRTGLLLKRIGTKDNLSRFQFLDKLWKNFKAKIKKEKIEKLLKSLENSNSLDLILGDIYALQERMSPSDIDLMLQSIPDLLSSYLEEASDPNELFELMDFALNNYEKIRQNYKGLLDLDIPISFEIIKKISERNWVNKIVARFISSSIKDLNIVKEVMVDKDFAKELMNNFGVISKYEVNFETGTLKEIFKSSNLDWMTIINMLSKVQDSELGTSYLDNVLEIACEKNEKGVTNIKAAIDEIFKDTDSLDVFLQGVFRKVRY